jgi:hypothetical protein
MLTQGSVGPLGRAAITGHASLKEIVRYTSTVDRKRLAAAAMEKVKAGTSSAKPVVRFDRKRKKSRKIKVRIGAGSPGRIRTSDQPVNSRLLYR